MSWKNYVLDATMGYKGGLFCFCPIEGDIVGDFTVVTGMMFLSDMPPRHGKLVAIYHSDGQEAVEAFCEQYSTELEELRNRLLEEEEDGRAVL